MTIKTYFSLRTELYTHQLQDLFRPLKQLLGTWLIILGGIAAPPLLAALLISQDKLSQPDQSPTLLLTWQLSYTGLLLLQWQWLKPVILALKHRPYLYQLPVSKRRHRWLDLSLTLISAHLFLLIPLIAVILMTISQQ